MAKKQEASNESQALVQAVPRALTKEFAGNVTELIAENLGAGTKLSLGDLTRIKIPAGGLTQFVIPSVTGQDSMSPHVDGVIIAHKLNKAYWAEEFEKSGGGTPPDCRSDDMVHGLGKPYAEDASVVPQADETGWLCESCPNNQFGSAKGGDGAGKACKDLRFMFFFTQNSLLPSLIVAPPTSLKETKKYLLGLTNEGILYNQVITRFELTEQKSKAGIKYAQLKPTMVGALNEEQQHQARVFTEMFQPMLGIIVQQFVESGEVYDTE